MKSVDITILIQAFNFFVAYWFLHRYVFMPAAQILEVEELQDEKLQKSLKVALNQREVLAKKVTLSMIQIKQNLQSKIPFVATTVVHSLENNIKKDMPALSDRERESIKKDIVDTISKVSL